MDTTTDFDIYPAVDTELIHGKDGIIEYLTKIGSPFGQSGSDDDDKDDDGDNLEATLAKKSEKLFSSTPKRVRAIVISLDTIRCVDEAFSQQKMERVNMSTFFVYANPMY